MVSSPLVLYPVLHYVCARLTTRLSTPGLVSITGLNVLAVTELLMLRMEQVTLLERLTTRYLTGPVVRGVLTPS